MNAFVVIPVYNEAGDLGGLLRQVFLRVPPSRVIVVDDGSRPPIEGHRVEGARRIRHPVNLGKGMALKTGCEAALAAGAEAIVLMDGDGQHDPVEIPRLLDALTDADIVFGARSLDWSSPWLRTLGNWVVNRSTRLLFGLELRDIWCGYRAFRAEAFARIAWSSADYAADVEMALRAALARLRRREVAVGTIYHDAYKGVTILDGLRLLLQLFAWRLTL
jgi:glycosyltransferase involved in cell wall biosynthesis